MIVTVCGQGRDMPGLVNYLYGKGKHNEHTDQHMVAASADVAAEFGAQSSVRDEDMQMLLGVSLPDEQVRVDAEKERASGSQLSHAEARALGNMVEGSWRAARLRELATAGVASSAFEGGVSTRDRHDDVLPEHVYHMVVALDPDEGHYSDEQWQQVAQRVVRGMGFESDDVDASCRWVAVHHGDSIKGNDHIHIAVCTVNNRGVPMRLSYPHPSDPTKTVGDLTQSQIVRRQIEQDLEFVTPLSQRGFDTQGAGASRYSGAEARRGRERAEAGRPGAEPDRELLHRLVRGAAESAHSEAHFLANLTEAGVHTHPRWAKGGQTSVVGYSVSLDPNVWSDKPGPTTEPVKISGGKLGPDLTLGRLRQRWEESNTSKEAAARLWQGVTWNRPGEDVHSEVEHAAQALSRWNDHLDALPHSDHAAWRAETERAAGTLNLIAARTATSDDTRGLHQLTHRLNQAVRQDLAEQTPDHSPVIRRPNDNAVVAARHLNLALRAGSPSSSRGWFAVLQQMQRTLRAIHTARAAQAHLESTRAAWDRINPTALNPTADWVNNIGRTREGDKALKALDNSRSQGIRPTRGPQTSTSRPTPGVQRTQVSDNGLGR